MDPSKGVVVRSYRDVVDSVERRIYRVDRWRLPTPHGVSVRALTYAAASLVAILATSGLPVIGALLGLLPASLRLIAVPALCGWALASLAIDGRPPHHALVSAARHRLGRRTLSALRPTEPVGWTCSPVAAIQVAPSGDEPRYRRGRVRGPATITLRYPARVEVQDRLRIGSLRRWGSAPDAARLRVFGLAGRPLARAARIAVGEGAEVSFE